MISMLTVNYSMIKSLVEALYGREILPKDDWQKILGAANSVGIGNAEVLAQARMLYIATAKIVGVEADEIDFGQA